MLWPQCQTDTKYINLQPWSKKRRWEMRKEGENFLLSHTATLLFISVHIIPSRRQHELHQKFNVFFFRPCDLPSSNHCLVRNVISYQLVTTNRVMFGCKKCLFSLFFSIQGMKNDWKYHWIVVWKEKLSC